MNTKMEWTSEDWRKYYDFLAEVFEYEDKYVSEYLAEAEANY